MNANSTCQIKSTVVLIVLVSVGATATLVGTAGAHPAGTNAPLDGEFDAGNVSTNVTEAASSGSIEVVVHNFTADETSRYHATGLATDSGERVDTTELTDDRDWVRNDTEYAPWDEEFSPIVNIGGCTGTLVSKYHVLTAAHCIYNSTNQSWEDSIEVSPGAERVGTSTTEPYGSANVVLARAYDPYLNSEDPENDTSAAIHDMALLTIDRPLGSIAGTVDWAYKDGQTIDESVYRNHRVDVAGYPSEPPDSDVATPSLWLDHGPTKGGFCGVVCHEEALTYQVYTSGGQSGSAVIHNPPWMASDETVLTDEPTILAVHGYGRNVTGLWDVILDDISWGARITKNRSDHLESWISHDQTGGSPAGDENFTYSADPAPVIGFESIATTPPEEWRQWTRTAPGGEVVAGETFRYETEIVNVGTEALTEDITVSVGWADETFEMTVPVDSLAPGESTTFSIERSFSTPGPKTVDFFLSPPIDGDVDTDLQTRESVVLVREDGDRWHGTHNDRRNTGYNPHTEGPREGVHAEWSAPLDGNVSMGAAFADGTVYAVSLDHSLYALDATSGDVVWSEELPSSVSYPDVAIGDGFVYVGGYGESTDGERPGFVHAFDVDAGDLAWTVETQGFVEGLTPFEGGVYAISDDILKIDAASESIVARVDGDGRGLLGTPAVYHRPLTEVKHVVTADATGEITAYKDDLNENVWNLTLDGMAFGPTVSNGRVFVRDGGNTLSGIDFESSDAERIWEYTTDADIGGSDGPVVVGGRVVVGDVDGTMYAVGGANGTELWRASVTTAEIDGISGADGTLYATTSAGTVVAVDATDGSVLWRHDPAVTEYKAPPTVANGSVYVGGWSADPADRFVAISEAVAPRAEPSGWSSTVGAGTTRSRAITVTAPESLSGVAVTKTTGPDWVAVNTSTLATVAPGDPGHLNVTASPPGGVRGSYSYAFRLSADGAETVAVGGEITVIESAEGYDVAVDHVSVEEDDPSPGDRLDLTYRVENVGDSTQSDIAVEITVRDAETGETAFEASDTIGGPYDPGNVTSRSVTWDTEADEEGYYTLVVTASSGKDEDPSNNARSVSIPLLDERTTKQYAMYGDTEGLQELGDVQRHAGYNVSLFETGSGSAPDPYSLPDGSDGAWSMLTRVKKDGTTIQSPALSDGVVLQYYADDPSEFFAYAARPRFYDGGRLAAYVPVVWGENFVEDEWSRITLLMGTGTEDLTITGDRSTISPGGTARFTVESGGTSLDDSIGFLSSLPEKQGWSVSDTDLADGGRRLRITAPSDVSTGVHDLWLSTHPSRYSFADGPATYLFRVSVTVRKVHDTAVTRLDVPASAAVTETVGADVTVRNRGDYEEASTVYAKVTGPGEYTLVKSADVRTDPGTNVTERFEWETSGLETGTYTVEARVATPGDGNGSNDRMERTVDLESTGDGATPDGYGEWSYRRSVTVTEISGTDLRNYPVVVGPFDIGDASPASIRVADESTGETIPFGLNRTDEGYEVAFEVDLGSDAERDGIAIYYGNENASAVAIPWLRARYNFYDGFDDGRIHPDWNVTRGEWAESDGTLKPSGDGVRIKRPLGSSLDQRRVPVYWETRVVSRSTGGGFDQRKAILLNENGDRNRILFMRTYQNFDDGVGVNIGWSSSDSQKLLTADQFAVDDWIYEEALLRPDGTIEAFARNEENGETGSRAYSATAYNYTAVTLADHGGDPGAEWDYLKLRYRVDPEPTATVGPERPVTGSEFVDAFTEEFSTGLNGWTVGLNESWIGDSVSVGDGSWSSKYNGSVRLHVNGGPNHIGLFKEIGPLEEGTRIIASYESPNLEGEPGGPRIHLRLPNGSGITLDHDKDTAGPEQNGTLVGTVPEDLPDGTYLEFRLGVWPGEITVYVENISVRPPDRGPGRDDGEKAVNLTFEDGSFEEFVVVRGDRSHWRIEENIDGNSLYATRDDGGATAVLDPANYSWDGNRTIEVDFRADDSHWKKNAHVVFGDGDDQWVVGVAVQGDRLSLQHDRHANWTSTSVASEDLPVADGAIHHLRIEIRGDRISVSLDGTEHISYTAEERIGAGTVGIGNGGGISHATWFDNLQVNGTTHRDGTGPDGGSSEIQRFEDTTPVGGTDGDLGGRIRVEEDFGNATTVSLLRSTATNYSLSIEAPDSAENVTFYLQERAISASRDVKNLTMYLDSEEHPFVVAEAAGPGESPWVAFNVPEFSTRTVTFASETTAETLVIDDDGGTDVDYTAIQPAIDNATDGDVIVVHAGVYPESVRVDKGVAIVSESAHGSSKLEGPGAPDDAPVLAGEGERYSAFDIHENVTGVRIEGLELRNYTHGVRAWNRGTDYVTVRHNTIRDANTTGVLVGGDPTIDDIGTGSHVGWTITSNVVRDPSNVGFEIDNLVNATVQSNSIHRTSTGDAEFSFGIVISANNATVRNVTLRNNSVTGTYDNAGIVVRAGYPPYGSSGSLSDVTIIDTLVEGDLPGDGILVAASEHSRASNVSVQDNTVRNATTVWPGVGVFVGDGSHVDSVAVLNNSLTGNQHGFGVNTDSNGTYDNVTVVDNVISANHQHGVIVADNTSGAGLAVRKNYIVGNGESGLRHNGTGTVNGTHNWWGASDGPDGDFNGSGDAVVGNVTVRPFYTDANLTTLSEGLTTCITDSVSGSDDTISLAEIQEAINRWAEGTEVPDTGGETISISEIQSLINAWAEDAPVSCS